MVCMTKVCFAQSQAISKRIRESRNTRPGIGATNLQDVGDMASSGSKPSAATDASTSTDAFTSSDMNSQAQAQLTSMKTCSRTASATGKCFFLDLPPELRNRIYECVYPSVKTENLLESNLLTAWAELPTKALLVTCRQIYEEAKLVYRVVWDGTEFTMLASEKSKNVRIVREIEDWKLERVTRVNIVDDAGKTVCALNGGVWMCICTLPNVEGFMRIKTVVFPRCRAGHVADVGLEVIQLCGTTSYSCVGVTDMDADAIKMVKKMAGKTNLRREELVAMAREAFFWARSLRDGATVPL